MRMSSGFYSWPLRRISRPRGWPRSTRSHTSRVCAAVAAALVLLVGVAAAAPFPVIGIAWHFLTGTPKALTEVYRAYGISIRSRPGGLQDHHLPTFVIDRRGIVLGAYGVSLRPQDVVKDLEQLVGQRTRGPSPPPALPSAPVSPSPPVATAPPAAHTVPLVAREFSFEPSEVTAPSGEVVFSVHNDGEDEHTFVLEDGARRRLAEISSIPVGKTRDRRVELAPGSYTIFCAIPGHREAGMVARLRVGN